MKYLYTLLFVFYSFWGFGCSCDWENDALNDWCSVPSLGMGIYGLEVVRSINDDSIEVKVVDVIAQMESRTLLPGDQFIITGGNGANCVEIIPYHDPGTFYMTSLYYYYDDFIDKDFYSVSECILTSSSFPSSNDPTYINIKEKTIACVERLVSQEDVSKASITIWPNPAQDFIQIESNEIINKVNIYTLNGQITSSYINTDGLLDIRSISAGVYFIELVYADKKRHLKKIVKN